MEKNGVQIFHNKPGRKGKAFKGIGVPVFLEDETEESLECHRKELLTASKTKPYDVHRAMELVYP